LQTHFGFLRTAYLTGSLSLSVGYLTGQNEKSQSSHIQYIQYNGKFALKN